MFWFGSMEVVAVPVEKASPPDMDMVMDVDGLGETMLVLSPPSTGPGPPPLKLDWPEAELLDCA